MLWWNRQKGWRASLLALGFFAFLSFPSRSITSLLILLEMRLKNWNLLILELSEEPCVGLVLSAQCIQEAAAHQFLLCELRRILSLELQRNKLQCADSYSLLAGWAWKLQSLCVHKTPRSLPFLGTTRRSGGGVRGLLPTEGKQSGEAKQGIQSFHGFFL